MTDRYVMVDSVCEKCGKTYKVRRPKFLAGMAKYCSKQCFYEVEREKGRETWGYEKGKKYMEADGNWVVRWYDEDGKVKTTCYPHWYYTMYVGEIPVGYVVNQIDGNNRNIDPTNFELISRKELNIRLGASKVGKYSMQDHVKAAISKANKGRKLPEGHRKKIADNIKSRWEPGGVYNTEKYRENLSASQIGKHSIPMKEESKIKLSKSLNMFYSEKENRDKMMKYKLSGESHPNWKGGLSKQKYPGEFSKGLRRDIYSRDCGICKICGDNVTTLLGRVHHIDANKHNNGKENLILLCRDCHGAVHGQWKTNDPVILAFRSQLYK